MRYLFILTILLLAGCYPGYSPNCYTIGQQNEVANEMRWQYNQQQLQQNQGPTLNDVILLKPVK